MTIKTKLRLAFLLMIALFAVFGAVALHALRTVTGDVERLAGQVVPSIVLSNAINTATSDYRAAEMQHILSTDPAEMARLEREMDGLRAQIEALRKEYEPQVDTPREQERYQNFSRDFASYLASSERLVALSRQNVSQDAAAVIRETERLFAAFSDDLVALVAISKEEGDAAGREAVTVAAQGRTTLLAGLAALIGFALFCMWAVDALISRPVAGLTGTLTRVGTGDLAVTVGMTERADDIGQMARAAEATVTAVRGLAADLGRLVEAAQGGALSVRVDPAAHHGEYAALVAGLNDLIELLSKPLFELVGVMQLLAGGDLKGRMTGSYEGDLRALKANMNRSLDSLVSLLDELAAVAGRMADGDLTRSVGGSYQGEFAVLKGNVNRALEQLRGLVGEVAANTTQITAAATETAAAARQVAQESARQLTSLTAVAGAVTQTAQSVTDITGNAARGRDLAAGTAALAEDGRAKLATLSGAVERIAAGHGRIEQITGTITRIADKTHILSLNAGIEAARAGEQGTGFGIVAQQIGRLAEEAALAARDIDGIIAESARTVHEGVADAGEARLTIERIAEAARDSGVAIQAISAALAQQSAAVQELVGRLGELRTGSEGNAAAAEEISATMEELARMVHRARAQVDRFTLA
ncbi:HAMP domain-containing methyl-accepting chemotaxis protein [Azospirillum thermophilum]|uniref:Methyl-accepting chemotaxis protein n=1 Tax=Azospirillum thermophilum TaxID=2202148 RepID=A0A2S2CQX0_9PROT|nr:methyl-accepting chemotaxis protein [Azospirillum thermophilum]AWK86923.1 hypothetical protein DEW08_12405 [Azospirillum thermophilum]